MNATQEVLQGPRHLDLWEKVLWSMLYGLICLLAVIGNTVVIYIILTRSHMRNPTNYFIANLALADAISGLVGIPMRFNAAMLQRWVFPNVLCHVMPFIESLTLTVSVLTLCTIAVDRYRSVAFFQRPALSVFAVFIIICTIWALSIACCLPYGLYHKVGIVNFKQGWIEPTVNYTAEMLNLSGSFRVCFPPYQKQLWWKVYNIYLTTATYFVPLVLIDGAYVYILYKVKIASQSWRKRHSEEDERMQDLEESRRRVNKLLIVVVLVFTFCWLPYELYQLLCEVWTDVNTFREIQTVFFAIHWLAMSNSCLNPIIYGIYNEKFQREYKVLLLRFAKRSLAQNQNSEQNMFSLLVVSSSVVGNNEVHGCIHKAKERHLSRQETLRLHSVKKLELPSHDGEDGGDAVACGKYIANELGFD